MAERKHKGWDGMGELIIISRFGACLPGNLHWEGRTRESDLQLIPLPRGYLTARFSFVSGVLFFYITGGWPQTFVSILYLAKAVSFSFRLNYYSSLREACV